MRLGRRTTTRELILPRAGTSFSYGRWVENDFPFVWHEHPELELTLIVAGRGTRHVGDSVEEFAEGDLVLIGSDTPHTWHTRPAPGVKVGSVVAQFRAERLLDAAASLVEVAPLRALFARARRGLVPRGAARDAVERELLAMVDDAEPLARLARLLAALSRFGDGSACRALASVAYEPPESRRDQTLARLQRYLHDHRAEPLPQSRVARVAGVSTAAFSRFFKTSFRRGYRSYLTEMRTADACRLLADTDRQVVDIALSCGFANLANFNRRFRQVKGMTPSAYRTAARGGPRER